MKRHSQQNNKVVYNTEKGGKITLYDKNGHELRIPTNQRHVLLEKMGHYIPDNETSDLKLGVTDNYGNVYYTCVDSKSSGLSSCELVSARLKTGKWVPAYRSYQSQKVDILFLEESTICPAYYSKGKKKLLIKNLDYLNSLSKLENKYSEGELITYKDTQNGINTWAKIRFIRNGQIQFKGYNQHTNKHYIRWAPLDSTEIEKRSPPNAEELFDFLFKLHSEEKEAGFKFTLNESSLLSDLNLFIEFFDQYHKHSKQANTSDYLRFIDHVVENIPLDKFESNIENIIKGSKGLSLKKYAVDSKNHILIQKILNILILEKNRTEDLATFFSAVTSKEILTADDFYQLIQLAVTNETNDNVTILLQLSKIKDLSLDANRLSNLFHTIAKNIITTDDSNTLQSFLKLAYQLYPTAMLKINANDLEELCIKNDKQECLKTLLNLHEQIKEKHSDFPAICYQKLKGECNNKNLRSYVEICQIKYNRKHLEDDYIVNKIADNYKSGFFSTWKDGENSIRNSSLHNIVKHALDEKPHLFSFFGRNNQTYDAIKRATGKSIKPSKDVNDALGTVRSYFRKNV